MENGTASRSIPADCVDSHPHSNDGTKQTSKDTISPTASLLKGLPNKGNFQRKRQRIQNNYLERVVPTHPTDPPANQIIKTDTTNILVRALQIKNRKARQRQRNDTDTTQRKKTQSGRKRISAASHDPQTPNKRVAPTRDRVTESSGMRDTPELSPICTQPPSVPRCRSPRIGVSRVTTPPPTTRSSSSTSLRHSGD